jgi:hypothetical protein
MDKDLYAQHQKEVRLLTKKIIKQNSAMTDMELMNWSMNQMFRAARTMQLCLRSDLDVYIGGLDAAATCLLKRLIQTKVGWDMVYQTNRKLLRGYRKPKA